jgi:hypothetical protein
LELHVPCKLIEKIDSQVKVHVAFRNTGIKNTTKIPISPETLFCLTLSSVLKSNYRCFSVKFKKPEQL